MIQHEHNKGVFVDIAPRYFVGDTVTLRFRLMGSSIIADYPATVQNISTMRKLWGGGDQIHDRIMYHLIFPETPQPIQGKSMQIDLFEGKDLNNYWVFG